jgi:hypothetical protein
MVTFSYSTGLVAVAEAPRETPADEIMAIIPHTNIGRASLSVIFFAAIFISYCSGIAFILSPSGDIGLVQHLGGC